MVWFKSDIIRYYHYSKIDILVHLQLFYDNKTLIKWTAGGEAEAQQVPEGKNLCPVHQRLTVVISTSAE